MDIFQILTLRCQVLFESKYSVFHLNCFSKSLPFNTLFLFLLLEIQSMVSFHISVNYKFNFTKLLQRPLSSRRLNTVSETIFHGSWRKISWKAYPTSIFVHNMFIRCEFWWNILKIESNPPMPNYTFSVHLVYILSHTMNYRSPLGKRLAQSFKNGLVHILHRLNKFLSIFILTDMILSIISIWYQLSYFIYTLTFCCLCLSIDSRNVWSKWNNHDSILSGIYWYTKELILRWYSIVH